jgi:hypothetical protein
MILFVRAPLGAHRLDEYLQATLISVEKNSIQAQIRLVPGIAVFPVVLAGIDTDRNGVISEAEQRAYAHRVLQDLSLSMSGDRLSPQLVAMKFPAVEDMKEGLGEIQLEIKAELPAGSGNRKLIFENRHQRRIGVYLVNCLVPRDPAIKITAQNRNYTQSLYELDYVQASAHSDPVSIAGWSGIALLLFTRLAYLSRQRA